MQILKADISHLEDVATLFNSYRVFYGQESDLEASKEFINERLKKNDSVILLLEENNKICGFTQLYPSFSSVSIAKIFTLNDLYVNKEMRKKGFGSALLEAASEYAFSEDAIRLVLSTHFENLNAQALYEKFGFEEDQEFLHFSLTL